MKRVLSVVLILATVLSCVCFCAYAESEAINGVYNNYAYYCYGIISTTSLTVRITYNDSSATLKIGGTYNYRDTGGDSHTAKISAIGKASALGAPVPSGFASFISAKPVFYIRSYVAATMSLSA